MSIVSKVKKNTNKYAQECHSPWPSIKSEEVCSRLWLFESQAEQGTKYFFVFKY